ncbi:gap junction delta-3 protein-like [Salvelinus fontinalis]|uniref:gap junction delta-3 protein-like n=1 Tax=Salvelinus fontinalis TaxID=8038 RepID=UPI002484E3EE|nr:gap junction delta-3 protein-like [Salvelinus fontinalis]
MGEWSFLSGLFDALQVHSPMLGRFWLLLMLVFRILILGTVAGDLFEDEQGEFSCNTLQPGCKQVCYDDAFPISQYRFWVFHIVLISTPSLIFLMYAMHHHNKRTMQLSQPRFSQLISNPAREERHLRQLYVINVAFRLVTEVGFLIGQWWLYGFRVEAQFPCSRFPCPYTVDCFVSRPMEKTVFLCFYFAVGVISALSSFAELVYASLKWFRPTGEQPEERVCNCQNLRNLQQEEAERGMEEEEEEEEKKRRGRTMSEGGSSSVRMKGGAVRGSTSRKVSSIGHKSIGYQGSNQSTKTSVSPIFI